MSIHRGEWTSNFKLIDSCYKELTNNQSKWYAVKLENLVIFFLREHSGVCFEGSRTLRFDSLQLESLERINLIKESSNDLKVSRFVTFNRKVKSVIRPSQGTST